MYSQILIKRYLRERFSRKKLIKFHENPSCGSRVVPCGRKDMKTVIFIKKIQQDATLYQKFIISYLYEAQYFSGDTPPIIRSLKLHWQFLVFHVWKVVGRVIGGSFQA